MVLNVSDNILNDYLDNFFHNLDQIQEEEEARGREMEQMYDQLRVFEETPVDIEEFVVSDRYLGMSDYIYPAGLWMLDMFYNPTRHYDDMVVDSPRFGKYLFPGFNQLDISEEQVASLNFTDLYLLIGQRSLKSVISAIIGLYETYKILVLPNPHHHFGIAPATQIIGSIGATSQGQAQQTVYAYVANFKDISPWFINYINVAKSIKIDGKSIFRDVTTEFEFSHKNLVINAVHAKSGSLRGSTRKFIVVDEISHFDEQAAQRSGKNIWDALSNSTETFKENAVRVAISSPLYPLDMMCKLFAQCGVKFSSQYYEGLYDPIKELDGNPIIPNPKALGFHYPTWDINPTLPYSYWLPKLQTDPDSTNRDFGAMPSQAKSPYMSDLDAIKDMFNHPEIDIPITKTGQLRANWKVATNNAVTPIYMHIDKGAGRPSNYGIAAGYGYHGKDESGKNILKVRIILAHSIHADPILGEVNFKTANDLVVAILRRISNPRYSSDGWNDIEFRQKLLKDGLVRRVENVVLNEKHYEVLKDLINQNRIECHPSEQGFEEIKRLELVNGKKVAKGIGFTKDLADCIAAIAEKCVKGESIKSSAVGKVTLGVYS